MTTDQAETIDYQGPPEEVGALLFSDVMGPTIEAAAKSDATPQQVARMLAGMLAGLAGTVAENFGVEAAAEMLRGTASNLERAAAAGAIGNQSTGPISTH